MKTIALNNKLFFSLSGILLLMFIFINGLKVSNSSLQTDENDTSVQNNAAKVALLGVFHFGGSSGDLASMHMVDPFGERRQNDIKELVTKLKAYQPTKILVEYPKKKNAVLKNRYSNYLAGKDTLKVNEIYQVGFRLAEQLKHDELYSIDHKLDLPFEQIVEYCQRQNKMEAFDAFVKRIQNYVQEDNEKLNRMSISEYLAYVNSDPVDQVTNDLYIRETLVFGDSTYEAGARVAATWWERNFIMLKNIAETIDNEDERILVIVGAAHRAVLKDLVIDRSDMDYVEIGDYLK